MQHEKMLANFLFQFIMKFVNQIDLHHATTSLKTTDRSDRNTHDALN
jgi:hypothetical protein